MSEHTHLLPHDVLDEGLQIIPADNSLSALLESIHIASASYRTLAIAADRDLMLNDTPGDTTLVFGLTVVSGEVEIMREGGSTERLQSGDFALLIDGASYRVEPADGRDCQLNCVVYDLGNIGPYPILHLLPPTVIIPGIEPWELDWQADISDYLIGTKSPPPFVNASINRRLLEATLMGVIIQYLTRNPWLKRYIESGAPARIGASLRAIHLEPEKPWTVASLARLANMSRTSFAVHFAECLGETPARYMTRFRLARACNLLRSGLSLANVAYRSGYGTDVAFSRAFKRELGISPGRFRAQHHGLNV